MKLLFALSLGLSLFFAGLVRLNTTPQPIVTSIRAFEEPLVTLNRTSSADEDSALVTALQAYQKRKSYEDVSVITAYLDANPQSPWKFSLLANLGIIYRATGHFSKAVDAWEQAWALGKGETNPQARALANQVAADLASLLSSLGRSDRLQSLLLETKGRPIVGSARVQLNNATENLWLMKNKPQESFKCGPYALDSILTFSDRKKAHNRLIEDAQSTAKGFSLTQLRDLSNQLKMNYQMAKRLPNSAFIIPSVINWKSGHYAALLKQVGDRYLVKDPTFGDKHLITAQALEDEASGYFLVPNGTLPSGWQSVAESEGDTVFGRGVLTQRDPANTKPNDCVPCQRPNSQRMAVYNILLMLVSLNIEDTPVGYTPPVGPDMNFKVDYNQLEANQPSTFTYFNFGPAWNCCWLSYVSVSSGTATVFIRGGGQEVYTSLNTTSPPTGYVGYYEADPQSQATLWVTTSGTYERRLPDGSKEVFGNIDSSGPVFLTSIVDPQGNTVNLTYDSSYRLTSIQDALGLNTTLTYGLSADPLKVTTITDPYNRSATFHYTLDSVSGIYQLDTITDVIGIQSKFYYNSGTSVINEMNTPYGNTTFSYVSSSPETLTFSSPTTVVTIPVPVTSLTVTEPDGSQVKAESRIDGSNFPSAYGSAPSTVWPGKITSYECDPYVLFSGTSTSPVASDAPTYLHYRNTYYWDKKATHDWPACLTDDTSTYQYSHIYHWLHTSDGTACSGILESEKPALENRIWYTYTSEANYESNANFSIYEGSSAEPTGILRVVGDPSASSSTWTYQFWQSAYNSMGNLTQTIDPSNRTTNYNYASNGIDVTSITQNNGGGTDTVKTLAYTGPAHCPTVITDAWGNPSASGNTQSTVITYNTQGQVTSVTPPVRSGLSAETTTYGYTSNFLTTITKPMSGAVTTIVPDTLNSHTINRPHSISDAESYTRTFTYDALDRVTQIAYPDSTTEAFSYTNPTTSAVDLDLHYYTDRLGRVTSRIYDSTRHLTSVTDPLTYTTMFSWCSCGSMLSMTDANSHTTYYNRDLESRLTSKVYPGGTQPPSSPDYTYDTVGRVATFTDKRLDVATYSYNADNTVSGVSYTLGSGSSAVSTPSVSYGYDTYYPRLTSAGGVSLTYYANTTGTLGAGQPETVTNTLTGGSAAITYTYDEWGRRVGSNIDSANSQSVVLDSLGRVTNVLNLLAPTSPGFSYSYFDNTHPTNRIGSITYPSGQSTTFNYLGNTGDERLSEIKNLTPASAVLSQNDYTYNADGTIATWQQQIGSATPTLWTDGYDADKQLTSAVKTNTSTLATVASASETYDPVGNRTQELATNANTGTFNADNQLTTLATATPTTVAGNVTPSSSVSVNGTASTMTGGTNFSSSVVLPGGTNTVTVAALDSQGNQRSNHYQFSVTPTTVSPTYDADGNELTNGLGQSYTWDVKNELVAIAYTAGANSGNHTEFSYDAMGRRIAIVERLGTIIGSGTVMSTQQLVWDGSTIDEERNVSNSVTKRFYDEGEQISGTNYYYTKDHLGSVREMTDSSGNLVSRLDYDPYGRATVVSGTSLSDFQYAGYYEHATSSLNLTKYRAYDSNAARWLSRDPIGETDTNNLYEYVKNDPINFIDSLGLKATTYYLIRDTGPTPYTTKTGIKCCKHTCYYSKSPNDSFMKIGSKIFKNPLTGPQTLVLSDIPCEVQCPFELQDERPEGDYKVHNDSPQTAAPG